MVARDVDDVHGCAQRAVGVNVGAVAKEGGVQRDGGVMAGLAIASEVPMDESLLLADSFCNPEDRGVISINNARRVGRVVTVDEHEA